MNGISALIKESPQGSSVPSVMWRHSEKMAVCEPGAGPSLDTNSASTLVLNFPASRSVRKTFLLFLTTQSLIFCSSRMNRLWQMSTQYPGLCRWRISVPAALLCWIVNAKLVSLVQSFMAAMERSEWVLGWLWPISHWTSSEYHFRHFEYVVEGMIPFLTSSVSVVSFSVNINSLYLYFLQIHI